MSAGEPPRAPGLATGTVLGGYTLESELGGGSTGLVYRARRNADGVSVALKILDDPARAPELETSIKSAHEGGRLGHPGIVQLLETGRDGDRAYVAMELIGGSSLSTALANRNPAVHDVTKALASAARALAHAHSAGVVHGGLDPSRILLAPDGNVKISGFGGAPGQPAYRSPEQLSGDLVDGRADIYSLGVLLYEACEGKNPFNGGDGAPRSPVGRARPERPKSMDGELAAVVLRALEQSPDNRPATCLELARELDRCVSAARHGPRAQRADGAPPPALVLRRVEDPGSSIRLFLVAVVAMPVVILGLLLWQRSHPRSEANAVAPETHPPSVAQVGSESVDGSLDAAPHEATPTAVPAVEQGTPSAPPPAAKANGASPWVSCEIPGTKSTVLVQQNPRRYADFHFKVDGAETTFPLYLAELGEGRGWVAFGAVRVSPSPSEKTQRSCMLDLHGAFRDTLSLVQGSGQIVSFSGVPALQFTDVVMKGVVPVEGFIFFAKDAFYFLACGHLLESNAAKVFFEGFRLGP